jgi:hypothetical protein
MLGSPRGPDLDGLRDRGAGPGPSRSMAGTDVIVEPTRFGPASSSKQPAATIGRRIQPADLDAASSATRPRRRSPEPKARHTPDIRRRCGYRANNLSPHQELLTRQEPCRAPTPSYRSHGADLARDPQGKRTRVRITEGHARNWMRCSPWGLARRTGWSVGSTAAECWAVRSTSCSSS